jgi:hypothetical protein
MSGATILRAIGLFLPLTTFGAQVPTFAPSSVLPANESRPHPLRRSLLVSIYGRHLGPVSSCTAGRVFIEPEELCGASVIIGGKKAGLLYVQDRQINLRVPITAPSEGMADFVVTYGGRSNASVPVRFAALTASVKLSGPAYVHMPVWIDIDLPYPHWHSLRYPMRIRPADFGGHKFEVRRNGAALPQLEPKRNVAVIENGPGSYSSIGGGGLLGLPHEPKNHSRLPLHLLYRFDWPGVYEVRYTGRDFDGQILVRSRWFRFTIKPFSGSRRAEWLRVMRQSAPSDPVELLSDYLPSLLAVPDSTVLSMLEDYLYNSNSLVRQYTANALDTFDQDLVAKEISNLLASRGPTPELAYLLSFPKMQFQTQAAALVRGAVRNLDSSNPFLCAGALRALGFLKSHYDWKSQPEMPGWIDSEVGSHAGRLLETRNIDIIQPLAIYLGSWKADKSRELLWRIVVQGIASGQALMCLTWIGDRRDLPRLGKYNTGNLDYHLNRVYGPAAAPYLKGKK